LSTAWLTQEMGPSYSSSSQSEQTTQRINRFSLHVRLASKVKQLVLLYWHCLFIYFLNCLFVCRRIKPENVLTMFLVFLVKNYNKIGNKSKMSSPALTLKNSPHKKDWLIFSLSRTCRQKNWVLNGNRTHDLLYTSRALKVSVNTRPRYRPSLGRWCRSILDRDFGRYLRQY